MKILAFILIFISLVKIVAIFFGGFSHCEDLSGNISSENLTIIIKGVMLTDSLIGLLFSTFIFAL